MEIPDTAIAAALDRVIADLLTPEQIAARLDAMLEERIGTVTIPELAARWKCDDKTARRTLKKFGVPVSYLSAKLVRVRTAAIAQLETDTAIVGGRRRRVTRPTTT